MPEITKSIKPLGHRAYGSIPHLPGSRRGPADKGLDEQQASILTTKARDKNDLIYVHEKLDGSNVSVAKINGELVPLMRAGYKASESNWKQHHYFHDWAMENMERFDGLLCEGQRVVGEWLMEAHGTRYNLTHEPFVVFDIMCGKERVSVPMVAKIARQFGFITPRLIHMGGAISIADVLAQLEPSGHGAIDPVEGAVWRVERKGLVDFLGKYVRPDKTDGQYLSEVSVEPTIYNWTPAK